MRLAENQAQIAFWAADSLVLKFELSPSTWINYLASVGEVLITTHVALLQIYSGHSVLQVNKYLNWHISAVYLLD